MLPRLVKIWWVGAGDFLLILGCKAGSIMGFIKTFQLQGFYFTRHDTGK